MEEDVVEDYRSALSDLNCNSKPLINMLTMLAEENVKQAPKIVQAIETHLQRVSPDVKLPVMYLIDSIIKNVGKAYTQLFTQNIVSDFCSVFEKVDEKTRMQLFKLRQTWSEVFPLKKMYAIDLRVQAIDPAWPVVKPTQANIHLNPKFLDTKQQQSQAAVPSQQPKPVAVKPAKVSGDDDVQHEMRQQLIAKQAELLRLKQQKLELDLLRLREQTLHKQGPTQPQVNKDPRITRRGDPRTVGNPNVNSRDPRLVSKSSIPSIPMPTTLPVKFVEPMSKERTVLMKQNVPQKPIEVPKLTMTTKLDVPIKDSSLLPKENKNSQSHSKTPTPLCSTKESSQRDKQMEQKNSDKIPPKMKMPIVTKSPNSKTKPKSSTEINDLPENKVVESGSLEEKVSIESSLEKSVISLDKKDDKRKDTKKRSPKSPSKKENKKLRDPSPIKKADKKGNKVKSPDAKNKPKPVTNIVVSEAEKPEQVRDVDLRILPPPVKEKVLATEDNEGSNENEPPAKKAKLEEKVDSLFGGEDQDYRLIPAKFSDGEDDDIEEVESPARIRQKNWAQYKAAHPDEFKSPLRPAKQNIDGETDKDFRITPFVGRQEGFDRLGRPILSRMGMERRPSMQEGHEELGSEDQDLLMLSKEQEILREAHQQLQARLITAHDHQLVIERFRALRSRFPQGTLWLNNEKNLQPIIENGNAAAAEDVCPNMANRLPPSKPILIDGKMRHIKFFAERAIVYMDDNKPYQITFTGTPTSFSIDGQELFFMAFGETREFTLNGRQHRVKFGSPSREIYLDDVPYAATFGGDPVSILLNGVMRQVKLGGPQPNVELSSKPIQDLNELQKAAPTREELMDVDMRDSFTQREKSPEPKEAEKEEEKLEDVDMRVPIAVQPQTVGSESPNARNSPLREPPNPDKLLAFMKEQEKNQSFGESRLSERTPKETPRLDPAAEWSKEQKPNRGPTDRIAGPPIDWQPTPQQVPMDWELTSQDQERKLKFQTFRPEDGQWRGEPQKEREWDWRRGLSNSNSPQRFDDFGAKSQEQEAARSGPIHRDLPLHLHPGHLQASHRASHNENHPRVPHLQHGPQQNSQHEPMRQDLGSSQMENPYLDPREDRLHQNHHRLHVDHHHGLPQDRPHIDMSHPGSHLGLHQDRLRQEMHLHESPLQGINQERPSFQVHDGPGPHHMDRPHQGPHQDRPHQGPLHQGPPHQGPPYQGHPHQGHTHQDQIHQGLPHLGQHPGQNQDHHPHPLHERLPHQQGAPDGHNSGGNLGPHPHHHGLIHPPDSGHPMGPRGRGYPLFMGSSQNRHPHGGLRQRFPGMRFPQEMSSGGSGFGGPNRFRPQQRGNAFLPVRASGLLAPPHSHLQQDNNASQNQPTPSLGIGGIDVTNLLSKLIASGLITAGSSSPKAESAEQDQGSKDMPPIELKPESLKSRHPSVIVVLYHGMQCASCGMRFQDNQQDKYSQHLDWHFRSNRREKDGAKRAFSRKWFYDVEDWVQFEELEDLEDRARSFFEIQADEEQFQATDETIELPSVVAAKESTENVCVVCGEPLQLVWAEESEEWHLRGAVRHDGKTYHPPCYEDFQKAQKEAETPSDTSAVNPLDTIVIKKEPEDYTEEESHIEDPKMDETKTEVKTEPIEEEIEPETNESKTETDPIQIAEPMETKENVETEVEVKEVEAKEEVANEEYHLEEEIIGVISETEDGDEDGLEDGEIKAETEMVIIQSGGIVLKMKAVSIAVPTVSVGSPAGTSAANDAASTSKEDAEKGELGDPGQDETDTEDEFVPPPPDPRFNVLPPVQRGKELSGLCSIM